MRDKMRKCQGVNHQNRLFLCNQCPLKAKNNVLLSSFFVDGHPLVVCFLLICIDVLLNINETTKPRRICIGDHMAIIHCLSYPLMSISAFKDNVHPRYQ